MKSFKIEIEISDAGETYTANNLKEAQQLAKIEAEDIYNRLEGRCSVKVLNVEEIKN